MIVVQSHPSEPRLILCYVKKLDRLASYKLLSYTCITVVGIRNFFQKIKRTSDDVNGSGQGAATITSIGRISSQVNTNTGVNIHCLTMHHQRTANLIQLAFEKGLTLKFRDE